MPKIFVTIFFLLISYLQADSQTKIIKIEGDVNSFNSEFNFLRIDDNNAFFTSTNYDDQKIGSLLYKSKQTNNIWNRFESNKYNIIGLSSGNITLNKCCDMIFFTACNSVGEDCSIYINYNDTLANLSELYPDIFNNSYNSQPHLFSVNNQVFLCFVSNRKGGFGGLDIWFSIIDNSRNLGVPINAGPKINTKNNEITPFYNANHKSLYYSSNDSNNNIGGYDIFRSEGIPNIWQEKKNVLELNSSKDEVYLTFYKEKSGYFSSNRDSECDENPDSCCNDIYEFTTVEHEKTKEKIISYTSFLPLNLYFDNNQPNPNKSDLDNTINYKDTYIKYFMKQDKYLLYNSSEEVNLFFEDSLKGNFNQLNTLLARLLNDLKDGYNIDIKIKGYTSQLADTLYNIKLSSYRIKSLLRHITSFKNGVFLDFIKENRLSFIEVPLGESESSERLYDNSLLEIYGAEAILNRKVSILKIDAYR